MNINDQRQLTVRLWENPTLLLFAPLLGLNISYCLELISLSGILLSFLGYYKILQYFFQFVLIFLVQQDCISTLLQHNCVPSTLGALFVHLSNWSSIPIFSMGYNAVREWMHNSISCATSL